MALLLVQSVFGGLTVIFRLPDWISTTHLGLALSFLALATVLASVTSRATADDDAPVDGATRHLAVCAPALVFAQSVLGGLVRHMDAGLACVDVPLCLEPLFHVRAPQMSVRRGVSATRSCRFAITVAKPLG